MELQTVRIAGDAARGDPPSPAVAALAPGATRGMVVIHEIFGRKPEIDRVVLRFADAGYAAVAPDLFANGRLRCMRAVMRSMRSAEDTAPLRQALRARAWLCEQSQVSPDKVGLIGFCFGGMFALAAGREWAAVSSNYGDVPSTDAMRGIRRVIACYGGRDPSMRGRDVRLKQRLARLDVTPEVHVYPDAGHSFLTDGRHPIAAALTRPLFHMGFHEASALDAWPKIMAFFERNL